MDPKAVESITKNIYNRFPEVVGVKPTVRKQPLPDSKKRHCGGADQQNYLLTFKGKARGPGGQNIQRLVRVVASSSGKIVKITTSK
jgi:hypothetical protein